MSRSAVLLCLLVAACGAAPSTRVRRPRPRPLLDGRIVGGEPVDISQYPWQISLEDYGWHNCGGSVIGSTWVLTAGHCVRGTTPSELTVRAGTSTRESGGTVFDVATIIEHELHSSYTRDYDFALLEIDGSFTFGTNVQAVGLGTSELAGGTAVTITGWGTLQSGGESPVQLQAVTTSIVDRDACNDAYGGDILDTMICAGEEEGGKDSCQGDSGGPLVSGSTQYGIVSWGYGCAVEGYPGVYANVPSARSWITEKTGI
uniref:Trypsin 2B n=1 Tax=Locusta migratoria TaxID=7004 RepID=X5MBK1_LOCMI|nr:TPA_exp: trypsin 2B [Locusta migratoria]